MYTRKLHGININEVTSYRKLYNQYQNGIFFKFKYVSEIFAAKIKLHKKHSKNCISTKVAYTYRGK